MENRLRDCQTTHYEGQIMRHILAHFKRILRELEAITQNQDNALYMQCLGSF